MFINKEEHIVSVLIPTWKVSTASANMSLSHGGGVAIGRQGLYYSVWEIKYCISINYLI